MRIAIESPAVGDFYVTIVNGVIDVFATKKARKYNCSQSHTDIELLSCTVCISYLCSCIYRSMVINMSSDVTKV